MLPTRPLADYNGLSFPVDSRSKSIPFGKYELLERINIGGMAEILKARDTSQPGSPILAVKRILPHLTEDQQFVTMFRDESRVLAQLDHENIIETFDVGEIGHQPYIAIEYIFGQDARMLFHRSRRSEQSVPIPVACYLMAEVCAGLHYAHEQTDDQGALLGLVHRDVSLQNVLLSYDGAVKLTDFGIAMSAENVARTEAGIVKGKFGYMSPEQIRGEPLDRRSDVFAMGICLYELLTSERLFSGDSDYAAVERVRNVDIDPPSRFNRQIPSALEAIVMKSLAKQPRDRYQTASDMRSALLSFMQSSHNECTAGELSRYLRTTFAEELQKHPTPDTLVSATKDSHAEGTGLAAFDNLDPISTVSQLHEDPLPQHAPAPAPAPLGDSPHRGLAPMGRPSVPPLIPRRESIPPSYRQAAAGAVAADPSAGLPMDWQAEDLPTDEGLEPLEPLPGLPDLGDLGDLGDDDVTRQVHIDRTLPGRELAESGMRVGNPSPFGAPSPFASTPNAGAITPAGVAITAVGGTTPLAGSIPPGVAASGSGPVAVGVSGAPEQGAFPAGALPRSSYGTIVGIVFAIVAVIAGGLFLARGNQPSVVHLTTQPRSVTVTVDGRELSGTSSPFVLTDLEPDVAHRVEVSQEGYESWNTTLSLRSGQTLELPLIALEPAARPAAAPVAASDTPAPARTPARAAASEPKPIQTPVAKKAIPRDTSSSRSTPKPRRPQQATAGGGFGTLRLNSRPWSEVTIDGRRVGNTPQMNLRLSAGTHSIQLKNPQFGLSKSLKVKVTADQTTTKIVTLQ